MPVPGKLGLSWINAQERGLAWIDGMARRRPRSPTLPAHLEVGLRGEQAALFELRRRGYTVVAQRWTSARARGDIDLIAWHDDTLCFVEVKTRTERTVTPAESAVDDEKRAILRALARAYLLTFPERERRTIPLRFDVVSVYGSGRHVEFALFAGAFPSR